MRESCGWSALVLLLFLIATLLITWPLAIHLDGFLLIRGYEGISHSDDYTMLKVMVGAKRLFYTNHTIPFVEKVRLDWDVCYPLLAFYILLAPAGFNVVETLNVFLLASVFLSGASMFLLIREISGDRLASLFGGFVYMSSGYVINEYVWGHPPLYLIHWIPLIFLLAEKSLKGAQPVYPLLLGVALSSQVYSSSHYAVYLSLILPTYIILRLSLLGRRSLRRVFFNLVLSLAVVLALSGYFILQNTGLPHEKRTLEENNNPPWVLGSPVDLIRVDKALNFGFVQVVLVVLGLCILWSRRNDGRYRVYWPFLLLLVYLVASMMGPLSEYAPYYWLYNYWPFIQYYRVPSRLFPFALMCVSVLSSIALAYMGDNPRLRRWRTASFALLIVALLVQLSFSVFFSPRHILPAGSLPDISRILRREGI
jgi:hypothetical protein